MLEREMRVVGGQAGPERFEELEGPSRHTDVAPKGGRPHVDGDSQVPSWSQVPPVFVSAAAQIAIVELRNPCFSRIGPDSVRAPRPGATIRPRSHVERDQRTDHRTPPHHDVLPEQGTVSDRHVVSEARARPDPRVRPEGDAVAQDRAIRHAHPGVGSEATPHAHAPPDADLLTEDRVVADAGVVSPRTEAGPMRTSSPRTTWSPMLAWSPMTQARPMIGLAPSRAVGAMTASGATQASP